MGKIAILKFTGNTVSATVTDFNNDLQARESVEKEGGVYAFVEVHQIGEEKLAPAKKAAPAKKSK